MSIRKCLQTAALAVALAPAPAIALNPELRLTQLGHTAWRVQDGSFSAAPNAIAQTADGYIWIGTMAGLVRFDGVRFVPWVAPGDTLPFSAAVYALLGASDDTLWIGTSAGLFSLKNNKLEPHVRGRINSIIEDRKHRIWVARSRPPDTQGGLCQAAGEQPRCIGGDDRLRLPYAVTLAEDADGNLWVGSSGQLLRWREDSHQSFFRDQLAPFEGLQSVASVVAVNDGSMWAAIPRQGLGVFHIVGGEAKQLTGAKTEGVSSLFVDRDQSIWMGTVNDGIYRLSRERLEYFRSANGLSSSGVTGFFEDREGNVWVATTKGLDRFRDTRVVTFSTAEGLGADLVGSVLATDDGRVWIGNKESLDIIEGNRVRSVRLPGHSVTSLWQDRAKRLWVGLDNELALYDGERFRKVKALDGTSITGITIAITEDRDGNLWASTAGAKRKLLRIRDLAVQEEFSADQVPYPRVLAPHHDGGIWLGLPDGRIAHYRNGKVDTISLQQGTTPVASLMVDPDGALWVSSARGLAHWNGRELNTLTSKNGLPCDAVLSAIRDRDATLWLYTRCGLVAIDDAEIRQWVQSPASTVATRVFDVLDGAMPGPSTFQPAVSTSTDGRLWFANDAVVQMLDPGRLRVNAVAPPVYVEGLRADRVPYAAGSEVTLPARSRDIEISYTALSFSVPEKVRFRYRLDGRDEEWNDAGTRRQVFYSDLAPGHYRFRVSASNNDGVWNDHGATLAFVVTPAYYQTSWFFALIAGTVAAGLWVAHRVRVRILERKQRDVIALNERLMSVQEQERVRIAGELHDGVMQEMLAATMILGTAKRRSAGNAAAQESIEKVQQKLIQMGTDLRQLSHELHPPALQESGLPTAIQGYCDEFSAASGISLSCDADPAVESLSRGTALALFRIVQEALGNAAKHARANRITINLARDADLVTLRVADDGVGFDRSHPSRGLGLITIRERAAQLGGKFEFDTSPGRGTVISVEMPFR